MRSLCLLPESFTQDKSRKNRVEVFFDLVIGRLFDKLPEMASCAEQDRPSQTMLEYGGKRWTKSAQQGKGNCSVFGVFLQRYLPKTEINHTTRSETGERRVETQLLLKLLKKIRDGASRSQTLRMAFPVKRRLRLEQRHTSNQATKNLRVVYIWNHVFSLEQTAHQQAWRVPHHKSHSQYTFVQGGKSSNVEHSPSSNEVGDRFIDVAIAGGSVLHKSERDTRRCFCDLVNFAATQTIHLQALTNQEVIKQSINSEKTHTRATYCFASFVQQLNELGGKPALHVVSFANPTVLVSHADDLRAANRHTLLCSNAIRNCLRPTHGHTCCCYNGSSRSYPKRWCFWLRWNSPGIF